MAEGTTLQEALAELDRIQSTHGARVNSLGLTAVLHRLKEIAALLARREQDASVSQQRLSTLTDTIQVKDRELAALEERLRERTAEVEAELARKRAEADRRLGDIAEEVKGGVGDRQEKFAALDQRISEKRAQLDQIYAEARGIVDRVDREGSAKTEGAVR